MFGLLGWISVDVDLMSFKATKFTNSRDPFIYALSRFASPEMLSRCPNASGRGAGASIRWWKRQDAVRCFLECSHERTAVLLENVRAVPHTALLRADDSDGSHAPQTCGSLAAFATPAPEFVGEVKRIDLMS